MVEREAERVELKRHQSQAMRFKTSISNSCFPLLAVVTLPALRNALELLFFPYSPKSHS